MKILILALCFVGSCQAMHVRQMVVGNIVKRWSALNGVSKFILPAATKDQKKRIAQLYIDLAHDAHRCNLKDIGEHADTKAVNLLEECDDEEVTNNKS